MSFSEHLLALLARHTGKHILLPAVVLYIVLKAVSAPFPVLLAICLPLLWDHYESESGTALARAADDSRALDLRLRRREIDMTGWLEAKERIPGWKMSGPRMMYWLLDVPRATLTLLLHWVLALVVVWPAFALVHGDGAGPLPPALAAALGYLHLRRVFGGARILASSERSADDLRDTAHHEG